MIISGRANNGSPYLDPTRADLDRLGIDARHDQGSTVILIAECCTLKYGGVDIPDLESPPQMNRGSSYMSG